MSLLRALPNLPIPQPADGDEIIAINSIRGLVLAAASSAAPLLVVTSSTRLADELSDELISYLGQVVVNFPAWETLPHERLSPKSDTVAKRIKALHEINSDKAPRVVVT